jgi:hypothetical protein
MEKLWNRIKYGYPAADDNVFNTGDTFWDVTKQYLHTGILELAYRYYLDHHPEIELYIDIIIQAGKDLHSRNPEIYQDAWDYLHSKNFETDCVFLGLNEIIIRNLFISSLNNKKEVFDVLNKFDEIVRG